MIQLRIVPYSEKEVKVLHMELVNVSNHIQSIYCANIPRSCSDCEVRHICNDLDCAIEYLKGKGKKK